MPERRVLRSLAILVALVFSKNVYLASLTSFYTFYLIHKFGVSVQSAQIHLFILLGAVAAGTFIGGPVGDRIGRKYVIWVSILGVLPFTLLLPYANLFWTEVLTVVIGLILASAFSAIVVFAQELVPGRVGTISGLFFGFAFGAGAVGAALLGVLADATSIELVFTICSFLPAIGLLTYFLPNLEPGRANAQPRCRRDRRSDPPYRPYPLTGRDAARPGQPSTFCASAFTSFTSARGPYWAMTCAAIAPPRRPQVARSRPCV